jgi:hypothetical protein
VLGLAHRLIVLREGRQVATLDSRRRGAKNTVLGYCFGVRRQQIRIRPRIRRRRRLLVD